MNQNYWWKEAIIYEVYVDKFAKNFKGMAEKLPYLKNLGVNCIWLLPHYPSPMIDGGYDVSDEHPWFKEASSSHNNAKRDYFLWSETGKELSLAYNPFSHMTEGNWVWNKKTGDYYYATFFKEQADLNWDNPAIFDEALNIIDFWSR